MDISEYQRTASETIQQSKIDAKFNETIHYLGLVGEVGSVVSEIKKYLREGSSYTKFKDQLKEELGDVLWYVSTIASNFELSLDEIATYNIIKVSDRYLKEKDDSLIEFDHSYPVNEQLPREFEVNFKVEDEGKVKIYVNEEEFGNELTDNSYEDDGYRFHDIFHFGYLAFLGWSPVVRKLLGKKRKSNPLVDEVEDGARAIILEELISLFVYNESLKNSKYQGATSIETFTLTSIKAFCKGYEVSICSLKQWEKAIIESFKIYNILNEKDGGRVLVSLKNRSLIYIGKN